MIFRYGSILLPICYLFSLYHQFTYKSRIWNLGLLGLNLVCAAISAKIMYDRYRHIKILGSLTTNPNLTSFANQVASFSAVSMFVGFLIHTSLFLFKVEDFFITALNIFVYGFGTLYMWMQSVITSHACTIFYDKTLTKMRHCLTIVSCVVLMTLVLFGCVSTLVPRGPDVNLVSLICIYIVFFCSYVITAIFFAFILSFQKDYNFFVMGDRPPLLFEEDSDEDNLTFTDTKKTYDHKNLPNAIASDINRSTKIS